MNIRPFTSKDSLHEDISSVLNAGASSDAKKALDSARTEYDRVRLRLSKRGAKVTEAIAAYEALIKSGQGRTASNPDNGTAAKKAAFFRALGAARDAHNLSREELGRAAEVVSKALDAWMAVTSPKREYPMHSGPR